MCCNVQPNTMVTINMKKQKVGKLQPQQTRPAKHMMNQEAGCRNQKRKRRNNRRKIETASTQQTATITATAPLNSTVEQQPPSTSAVSKSSGGPNHKHKRRNNHRKTETPSTPLSATAPSNSTVKQPTSTFSRSISSSKPSSFLEKMKAKLAGGHFRMINEKLYTCSGDEALSYFREDPSLFNMYHTGYQEQMSRWPEQPVNIIIKWLKDHSPSLVVADFGCGDARLAKGVKNKVFSIDLVSNDPSVIACDMSNTPLDSSSIDVTVFCLSLMGTNFPNYLQEAHRVLKPSGWLLIAEVKSRFDPNTGGADPDRFIRAICQLGFTSVSKDFSNKMFILLYFKKKLKNTSRNEIKWPELKPCLYKRR